MQNNLARVVCQYPAHQSRTGDVLGAVPSAAVMGARRIFFPGEGGKFRDTKKLTIILVVTLKTQVFIATTNAQNTLQHFQGEVPFL